MGLKNYDISLLLKKSQSNLPICLENTAVGTLPLLLDLEQKLYQM